MMESNIDGSSRLSYITVFFGLFCALYVLVVSRTVAGTERYFVPVIVPVYLAVPVITAWLNTETKTERFVSFTAVFPGLVVTVAALTGFIPHSLAVLLLFVFAGIGSWVWGMLVYAAVATDMYVAGRMSKEKLGLLFVPISTGMPLGYIFWYLGVMRTIGWMFSVGMILVTLSALTILFFLRNR